MKENQPRPNEIQNQTWNVEKDLRHLDNLKHLKLGRWHGTLFIDGVGQPKEKLPTQNVNRP